MRPYGGHPAAPGDNRPKARTSIAATQLHLRAPCSGAQVQATGAHGPVRMFPTAVEHQAGALVSRLTSGTPEHLR